MVQVGFKADAGKPRWSLLPWKALSKVVKVLEWGATRYAPDNWRTVQDWEERYFNALIRHVTDWRLGQRYDPETGYHHLAHAACNVLFLLAIDADRDTSEPLPVVQVPEAPITDRPGGLATPLSFLGRGAPPTQRATCSLNVE
jgi:hypothetical protein